MLFRSGETEEGTGPEKEKAESTERVGESRQRSAQKLRVLRGSDMAGRAERDPAEKGSVILPWKRKSNANLKDENMIYL